MIRPRFILLAAAATALVLPAAAAAKGPSAATISGPGLSGPLAIEGYGEGDSSTPLGILVSEGGFFSQAFGASPTTQRARPVGQLGSKYTVTYTVPGPSTDTLRQDLYPYAAKGPVSYMAPNQQFWGTQRTVGGWYRGTVELKTRLVAAGLPKTDPNPRAGIRTAHRVTVAVGAGAGILLAGGALLLLRRRRR